MSDTPKTITITREEFEEAAKEWLRENFETEDFYKQFGVMIDFSHALFEYGKPPTVAESATVEQEEDNLPDWLQGEYSEEKGEMLKSTLAIIPGDRKLLGFPSLPHHLPAVPEVGVYLGKGPLEFNPVCFKGWYFSDRDADWDRGSWHGAVKYHYCADLNTESGRKAAWLYLMAKREVGK